MPAAFARRIGIPTKRGLKGASGAYGCFNRLSQGVLTQAGLILKAAGLDGCVFGGAILAAAMHHS